MHCHALCHVACIHSDSALTIQDACAPVCHYLPKPVSQSLLEPLQATTHQGSARAWRGCVHLRPVKEALCDEEHVRPRH